MCENRQHLVRASVAKMELTYESESDFYKMLRDTLCTDTCECGGHNEMFLKSLLVQIAHYKLELSVIPILTCTKCQKNNLPYFTKELLHSVYKELLESGQNTVYSTPSGYQKRYQYATSANFIYDHWDYECIPGLNIDFEHPEEGFLTPVYFDKRALVSFINLPEYNVDIFSESYGQLSKYANDQSGYKFAWSIPFGFNTNGKLIFWLGDLDYIDDTTCLQLLKAYNVDSDHLLTDSEFYQAQMRCVFSDPIVEKEILLNKQRFIKNVKQQYNIELNHLSTECQEHEASIKRPVVFTVATVSHIINAYDKILVEGISVNGLRMLYEKLVDPSARTAGYLNWQSIKLLDGILYALSQASNVTINVYDTISPLYILHDYRILLDHLLSREKQEETQQHILETLDVATFEDQEQIYIKEIHGLKKLFSLLALLTTAP